jgi:hypothetical protein
MAHHAPGAPGGAPPGAAHGGGAAPPGAPPLGGALPVATPAPRTYRELYNDASNSPAPNQLANYMQGYRFDAGGPAPAMLRDQTVVLSDRQPMAFLCLVTGAGGTPEVSIMHRLMRYMDMPGEPASGFHDRVIGLLGDIMPHQYPAIDVPGTTFHLAGSPVRVPTTASMAALLPTWNPPNVPLGPYTDEDPETEVVRPRNVQLIPGYYAAILVHRRGVTAKQAYEDIVGAIQARGELEMCQDVVTWLKSACTARGGMGAQNTVPIVYHPLTPVHLPPAVYAYLTSKVRGDLPALMAPDASAAELTGTLAGALRALTREGAGVMTEERRDREAKTVQEVYKETYRTLPRYCNVGAPSDVAQVWGRLANCAKSEQHTVLVQEFQRVCRARGLATELYTPVVTASLKQMVVGLQFVGMGVDDLSSGCQPFAVSYAGGASQLQALASAEIGNQLAQGEHNASLADYRTLREQEKVKFPRDIMDVVITLGRFAVLGQALFQGAGPDNPFVAAMWKLYAAFQNAAPFITDRYHQQVAATPNAANVYYPCILRAIQVNVHEYMHEVGINVVDSHDGVDLPDFKALLWDLRHGTFRNGSNWVPLPEGYMTPVRSTSQTTVSRTPSGVATGGSTASTAQTGVSSLTTDTRTTMANRVENQGRDADFSSITIRPGGTRPLLRDNPPPRNDAGHEFCVAWWTRNSCFDNCRRRITHVPFASDAERTRLLVFCRTHLAAPAPAATRA